MYIELSDVRMKARDVGTFGMFVCILGLIRVESLLCLCNLTAVVTVAMGAAKGKR